MKLNQETGLYENYGIWHTPFWQTTTFYIICYVLIAILIIALFLFFLKKYRARKAQKSIPSWDVALQELEQLKKSNMVTVAQGKQFYLAITAIIKRYFEKRFGYDVLGKTDKEVITYLKNKKVASELLQNLEAILGGSVVIKFANAQAAQDKINEDFDRSIMIIKCTISEEK